MHSVMCYSVSVILPLLLLQYSKTHKGVIKKTLTQQLGLSIVILIVSQQIKKRSKKDKMSPPPPFTVIGGSAALFFSLMLGRVSEAKR